jgi:glycosyltransferase involved in cell wall biosynthesis
MSRLKVREDIKILFVSAALHSYVRRDLEILQKHFDVKNMKIKYLIPRRGRDSLVFLRLLRGVLWADVIYCWFVDWNAFFLVLFCMLLCKKCMIVVGGYEVVYEPEINYGALLSLLGRLRVKFVLKRASKILAVSNSSVKEMLRITKPRNFKLLYNGVNTQKFKPSGPKEDLVITCARSISDSTIKKKSLDTFVETSVYLPNFRFVLIGRYNGSIKLLKKIAGSNVMFTGYVSDDSLLHYYRRAKVYCQLSAQESFGVALAEAMSCCCVPVVTRRYALPEVVGDTGFYVPYDNPEVTAETVRKALESDRGRKARERIKKRFSLEAREKKLIEEILDLTKNTEGQKQTNLTFKRN